MARRRGFRKSRRYRMGRGGRRGYAKRGRSLKAGKIGFRM